VRGIAAARTAATASADPDGAAWAAALVAGALQLKRDIAATTGKASFLI
jgi:hypothetical protein